MRAALSIVPILTALALASASSAAELPAQASKKAKPPEAVKHCNIAGFPGMLGPSGICIRMSGYVSAGVGAGQIK
jgi:hypothetical protein